MGRKNSMTFEKSDYFKEVLFTLILSLVFNSGVLAAEFISPLESPKDLDSGKIQLGKQLFHDVRLSNNENISCATCHVIEKAGTDGLALSPGTNGELTGRNTPTIFNSRFNISQFWDGRADNLEEQIDAVVNDPVEMGADWESVIKRLSQDSDLVEKMSEIYKPAVSKESVIDVLAEYMKALVTVDSPFDKYLRGDHMAINEQAKEGYKLFKNIGCISCHQGVNVGGNLYQRAGVKISIDDRVIGDTTFADDFGRFNFTGRERDKYIFRVPSLRNVAQTAPYFHNGQVANLDAAILIMARSQLGKSIELQQVNLIKEFLYALNGELPQELK